MDKRDNRKERIEKIFARANCKIHFALENDFRGVVIEPLPYFGGRNLFQEALNKALNEGFRYFDLGENSKILVVYWD